MADTPADELRQAAATLRDVRNCSNYDVDCDSMELLKLIDSLLVARESFIAILDEIADEADLQAPGASTALTFHLDHALAAARAINAKREGA